ncbi:nucleotide exchange factor GrpE [Mongoliimonas terrestris]|uniref:nucleotide exchange factor GrpE n=1 Tax=Mongoliimonas terrestris TaxID=1709001 RepID=UPI0009495BE3|nr:nucleotide exchange factor GrpE [Mongoliimonas terrestris]
MIEDKEPVAPAGDETAAASTAPNGEAKAGAPADGRLEALEAEVSAVKDQLLRTLAEMENLRRRTEREVADTRTYAVAGFARDILQVGDNLSRALQALPADAREGANAAVTALLDGVEMTERELLKAFEKHGVRKIEPVGERFDPNFHQAMFEVPNPEVPNGTVVQVVQSGYVIGERVLRPAMVGVARGGPKAAPKPAEPADAKVDKTV